jgi:hypothetical protein
MTFDVRPPGLRKGLSAPDQTRSKRMERLLADGFYPSGRWVSPVNSLACTVTASMPLSPKAGPCLLRSAPMSKPSEEALWHLAEQE